jgi:hypothetical protein
VDKKFSVFLPLILIGNFVFNVVRQMLFEMPDGIPIESR